MFRFLRWGSEPVAETEPIAHEKSIADPDVEIFKRHGKGPLGPRGTGSRVFDAGSLRLLVLGMIGDEPRHGYDIIKHIRVRFHGAYAPSPGSIYPILKLLESTGLIGADASKGKRRYTIQPAGRTYLALRKQELDAINIRLDEAAAPIGDQSLGEAARDLGDSLYVKLRKGELGAARAEKLRAILLRARDEIEAL